MQFCIFAAAQNNKDTASVQTKKKNNIFKFAMNAMMHSTADSIHPDVINKNGEDVFKPYNGKGIRKISVRQFGFEKTFTDTSKHIDYFGTKILNNLHHPTRNWVIMDNVFFKEKSTFNSYLVADNERYFRSLPYIQDARIIVVPVPNEPDSVDVVVVTKDLFTITGEVTELTNTAFKGSVGDANVLGMAQRVQFGMLIESNRSPAFGYSLLYSKNNIAGTFINATIAYSTFNGDITDGTTDEEAKFIRIERPLMTQYAHLAGAFSYGNFQTNNVYNKPDSIFYKYDHNVNDMWLGYNLNVKRYLHNIDIKGRQFIALRYLHDKFFTTPDQVGNNYNFRYNDKQAVLGQLTLFKQLFYKTNYLFNFGTTEDIPYGYNIAFSGGWYKQIELTRPYAGVDANRYFVTKQGHILQYFLRAGTFINNGFQDASVLVGSTVFSRLYILNQVKLRQYLNISYTKQFNRLGLDPLKLNNVFGIPNFNTDSITGYQRITLHSETFMFLRYKVFGFKFAPFAFGDIAGITPENMPSNKTDFYYGIGGGVRTRNENFVFGTIEFRGAYFPRAPYGVSPFKLMINANINFKYNSSYVHAPEIIQNNNDISNSIY
jgi:hypothetical protein